MLPEKLMIKREVTRAGASQKNLKKEKEKKERSREEQQVKKESKEYK